MLVRSHCDLDSDLGSCAVETAATARKRGDEELTYCDADIDQKVSPDEAITSLCRLIADLLLGQPDGVVDEERLAEGERRETGARWNGLENCPFQDTK